jgi:hypothetical protein
MRAASPGRVFSVVSRMRCSNSGVNTLGERWRRRMPVVAVGPFFANAARNASTVGGKASVGVDARVGYALMSEQQDLGAERHLLREIAISNPQFEFTLLVNGYGPRGCGSEHASV